MASTSSKPWNKAGRAKTAKETINNTIPHILKSNTRALAGIKSSELIHYSPSPKVASTVQQAAGAPSPQDEPEASRDQTIASLQSQAPKVRVIQSDTFDAAQSLDLLHKSSRCRIGVLNMASALRAGGGVLNGSLAQEESLCTRSTLYPSLKDAFYRIPENAAIYSPDVLIFRASDQRDLPKADWFFVDVVSCAALKHPDVVEDSGGGGKKVYELEKDKEAMTMKIRLIFQIARQKQMTHLVLGALGCGVFRNPPEEVAKIFKRVILGDRKRAGIQGIQEIVFAIFDDGENLRVFREVFQDVNPDA